MGLNFSHGKAAFGYREFNRFRTLIAMAEYIPLDKMEGFDDTNKYNLSWEDYPTKLKPFLQHSDCDGCLTPLECMQIIPRLVEIFDQWLLLNRQELYIYAKIGKEMTDGMQMAVANNEPFKFQ